MVAGGVHTEPAAEVHADRRGAMLGDDRAQPVADVVEPRVPRRGLHLPVDPHHRPLDPVGMVVDLR
jgi:hypothetical protein